MVERGYNVLFLCTGNSARSIMAEALLNFWGRGRFQAFRAGSHPKEEVHPLALDVLDRNRIPAQTARSKSWDEFATPDAPLRPAPPGSISCSRSATTRRRRSVRCGLASR